LLEDQCGDRRLVVADLRPFAEQQHELGDVAVGDENLAALDDDRVAVRGKSRLHAGGVGSGGRLGDGQRAEPTGGNAREESLFLLRAADVDERFQSVECRGIDDPGRGAGLGNDFHHREVEPVGHPEPAIGRRHEDRVGADGVERADVVPRELTGAIDLGGLGGDDAVGHAPDLIEHQPLVLRPVPLALQGIEDVHGPSRIAEHRGAFFDESRHAFLGIGGAECERGHVGFDLQALVNRRVERPGHRGARQRQHR